MPFRHLSTVVVASLLAALTGCVVAPPRDRVVYGQPSYGQPSYGQPAYGQPVPRQVPAYAEYGRVENIGFVQSAQRPSGAGAVLGAVIGGAMEATSLSWGIRALTLLAVFFYVCSFATRNQLTGRDEAETPATEFENVPEGAGTA